MKLIHWNSVVTGVFATFAVACSGEAPDMGSPTEVPVATLTAPLTLVNSQPIYAGIWNPSTVDQSIHVNRTYDQFIEDYSDEWSASRRLISIATSVINGEVRYSGVWNPSTTGQYLRLGRNRTDFQSEYNTLNGDGYRVIALSTYVAGGSVYYDAVYSRTTSWEQRLKTNRTYDQFIADYSTAWSDGLRLKLLTTNVVDGVVRYNGVWSSSTSGQYLRLGRTYDELTDEYDEMKSNDYRLGALSTYVWNNELRYNATYNPGTQSQSLSRIKPIKDFTEKYEDQWDGGRRLSLIVSNVEAIDIDKMAADIDDDLTGHAVGFAATVGSGSSRARVTGGQRRTEADAPASSASNTSRINVASVTKTFTAVAVLQLLKAKGLSVDTKMHTYLPSNWSKGSNITGITFKELLTHTSGLRVTANTEPEVYAELKKTIANGVKTADKVYKYNNQNFAIFRIIIPYLNGFSETGVDDKEAATAAAYIDYMNEKVFAPAGLSTIRVKPTTTNPTQCYPLPADDVNGWDFGDWTNYSGGAGLHLSTDDLAKVLVSLRDGSLLSSSWVKTMNSELLGWQDKKSVRHGSAYRHGGYLWYPTDSNGKGELNAGIINFSTGPQLGIIINSRVDVDYWDSAFDAYNDAWYPIE